MKGPELVVTHTRISEAEDAAYMPEADVQRHDVHTVLTQHYGPEGKGWVEVAHNHEHDTSAWKKGQKRPVFDETMALCKSRAVTVLAAWCADRVYRRTETLGVVCENLGEDPRNGVKFLCYQGGVVDLTTAVGRMQARNMANHAQFESDIKSERIRAQVAYAARQGWAPAVACYGLQREGWGRKRGGTFVHVPEAVPAIVRMADLILHPEDEGDGLSLKAVADRLNEEGLDEHRGRPWSGDAVIKLIKSPSLAGLIYHDGELLPGNWEPIIAPDQWEAIQVELSDPSRKKRRKRGLYWLRPVLLDVKGRVLVGGRATDPRGPRLPGPLPPRSAGRRVYHTPPGAGGPSVTIDADAVEQFLYDATEAHLPQLQWHAEDGPIVTTPAERRVAEVEVDLEDLAKERLAGELTKGEWRTLRAGLLRKLDEAREEARLARRRRGRRPGVRPGDVVRRWGLTPDDGGLTDAERQRLVRWAAGRMEVLPASVVTGFRWCDINQPEAMAQRLRPLDGSPLGELWSR